MKNIHIFKEYNLNVIKEVDDTGRNIGYSLFTNCKIIGRNTYYPNVLLHSDDIQDVYISPYDEKIMSLNKESFYDNNIYTDASIIIDNDKQIEIDTLVFFFIYNFDNYYHFLYDTLPYLYTYLYVKKNMPTLKLIINYPNKDMTTFYKFNMDILAKIIDIDNDIIIHNDKNIYKNVYISTSLTHGGFSNNPPRKEIYHIYDIIKNNINYKNIRDIYIDIDKIYISRRTWINNDTSNIGTNYTTRRKMMNEDELVEKLTSQYGIREIFSENLNTDEKIYIFSNATLIIGSIGGGMSNLLFSRPEIRTIVIVTPFFLDINYRFKYSMEHTHITYFNNVDTYVEDNKIPLNCRVKITDTDSHYYNRYGEISEYNKENDTYLIHISNNDVAGFNNKIQFDVEWFHENNFVTIDNGLNSPYTIDINMLLIEKIKGFAGCPTISNK